MTEEGGPGRLDLRGRVLDVGSTAPAAAHLADGGVLVYPTETVYGMGSALTPKGLETLARLKRRPADKPFIVLLPDADHANGLGWTDEARELADVFWPGAVTLVLADPAGIFPTGVRSPSGTVAVRVSPHPFVQALLEGLGAPVTSTSANPPGVAPARSGEGAMDVARGLGGAGDVLVVDVGTLPDSAPSTLVDCSGPRPVVVRQGSVPVGRLRCVLPEIDDVESE